MLNRGGRGVMNFGLVVAGEERDLNFLNHWQNV
jgi:hypothetical protein